MTALPPRKSKSKKGRWYQRPQCHLRNATAGCNLGECLLHFRMPFPRGNSPPDLVIVGSGPKQSGFPSAAANRWRPSTRCRSAMFPRPPNIRAWRMTASLAMTVAAGCAEAAVRPRRAQALGKNGSIQRVGSSSAGLGETRRRLRRRIVFGRGGAAPNCGFFEVNACGAVAVRPA